MRQNNKRRLKIGIGIIAGIIVLAALAWFGTRLSIGTLGEEGYNQYDALMAGGSLDRSIWMNAPDPCRVISGYSCDGGGNFQHVSVGKDANGEYIALTSGGNPGGEVLSTGDLRLKDFKAEFMVSPGRGDWTYGGGSLLSSKGLLFSFPAGSYYPPSWTPASVELTWDNYELGHYQIKVNGKVVQDGNVPEGTPLTISIQPSAQWIGSVGATAYLYNPRYKTLFNCDLTDGTVKASVTLDKPGDYDITDLRGFKSFCPNLEQLDCKDGLCANRNRVIYNLSGDGKITINQNEFWEIQYIAERKTLGVSNQVCSLWDVDAAKCTGKVDLCNGAQFVQGVGCVSLQNNLADLKVDKPVIEKQTITWTSYARYTGVDGMKDSKLDLMSGDYVFMQTSTIKINEGVCPYEYQWQQYPQDKLSDDCFSVSAFGKDFHRGDMKQVSDYLSVKLSDLSVQYRVDDQDGKEYSFTAKWELTFDPAAITLETNGVPDSLQLGEIKNVPFAFTNNLPGDALYTTSMQVEQVSVGERLIKTANADTSMGAKSTVTLRLPTDILGENKVMVWNTLQTEYGGIAFKTSEASYQVTSSTLDDVLGDSHQQLIKTLVAKINAYTGTTNQKIEYIKAQALANDLTKEELRDLISQLTLSPQDRAAINEQLLGTGLLESAKHNTGVIAYIVGGVVLVILVVVFIARKRGSRKRR